MALDETSKNDINEALLGWFYCRNVKNEFGRVNALRRKENEKLMARRMVQKWYAMECAKMISQKFSHWTCARQFGVLLELESFTAITERQSLQQNYIESNWFINDSLHMILINLLFFVRRMKSKSLNCSHRNFGEVRVQQCRNEQVILVNNGHKVKTWSKFVWNIFFGSDVFFATHSLHCSHCRPQPISINILLRITICMTNDSQQKNMSRHKDLCVTMNSLCCVHPSIVFKFFSTEKWRRWKEKCVTITMITNNLIHLFWWNIRKRQFMIIKRRS